MRPRFNWFDVWSNRLFLAFALSAIILVTAIAAPAKWSRVESNTLAWLRSVYFINEDVGWIVGSKGTFLKTVDGGRSWKQEKKFTNDNIRDLHFSDAAHGWLLCERDIYNSSGQSASYFLRTSNGGITWESVELTGPGDRLVHLFFTRDGYGYAVGEGGAFWQTLDDKETWRRVELPVRYLMLSVAFLDDLRGVLVGGGGTALFTIDGGVRWEAAAFANSSTTRLNSVAFIDRENGWAVGASGKIFVTNNGGRFWKAQHSSTDADLSDVYFVNSKVGIASGDKGIIVETNDGGRKWATVVTGVKSPLESVYLTKSARFVVGYGGVILVNRTSTG